jgi:hypothetical protein
LYLSQLPRSKDTIRDHEARRIAANIAKRSELL